MVPDETVEKNYASLTRRLDAIIRLLMEQQVADDTLQKKDQVMILASVGLTSGEIGRILGRPSKDVSSWIKRLKAGQTKSQSSSQNPIHRTKEGRC